MRLIFHMGLHKTGSTFLQGVLRHNAAQLQRRGVHYALASGFEAHHDIAWAMMRGDFRPLATATAGQTIGPCEAVVLSSEDFESLLITPQMAQRAEELGRAAGFDCIEWHVYVRRQDEYFWSLYCEMSKHIFVDPLMMFHQIMLRGYASFDGPGAGLGAPFWHFCFDWFMIEKFASLVTGKTVLYSFSDEVPFPGRGFITNLTGGTWWPTGLPSQQKVNARLSDPEMQDNYALRFVEPLEQPFRDMFAIRIRRRSRVGLGTKRLINEQLQARYFSGNQAVFERFGWGEARRLVS